MSSLSGHDPKVNKIPKSKSRYTHEVESFSFSAYDCKKYGINAALFIQRIRLLTQLNKSKEQTFFDDRYWTYNTIKEIQSVFFFFSTRVIDRIIAYLKQENVILVKQPKGSDRTSWYSLTDEYLKGYYGRHNHEIADIPIENMETDENNTDLVGPITPKWRYPLRQNGGIENAKMARCSFNNIDRKNKDTQARPLGRLEEEIEICLVEKKPISNKNHESSEFCSAKAEPRISDDFKTKKKEKRKAEVEEIHREIIAYLNDKAGKHFRTTTVAYIKLIDAKLREEYTLDDFKKVIDSRVESWKYKREMHEYLRPNTLFGSKFDQYLNSCAVINTHNDVNEESDQTIEKKQEYKLSEKEIKDAENAWDNISKKYGKLGRKHIEISEDQIPW